MCKKIICSKAVSKLMMTEAVPLLSYRCLRKEQATAQCEKSYVVILLFALKIMKILIITGLQSLTTRECMSLYSVGGVL